MAQQNIIIGTADGGTGDTYFDAFTKTQANFTELFTGAGNNAVYLYSEADLPNQTATTWTMDEYIPYIVAANFSTNLQCVCANGASLSGNGIFATTYEYTGNLSMFTGTDIVMGFNNVNLLTDSINTAFDFTETVPFASFLFLDGVSLLGSGKIALLTNISTVQINCSTLLGVDGIEISGQTTTLLIDTLSGSVSSVTGKYLDLGTSVFNVINIEKLLLFGPVGSFGISGLANSGNIAVGILGNITQSDYDGGMTDLENLDPNDDARWNFRDNRPTPDTFPDALISFRNNATETVIAATDTPVLVAGTWTEQQVSLFSSTAAGRLTWLAERDLKAPTTVSCGLISSGGGSIDVTVYIFVNGVEDTASGTPIAISGSDAQTLTIPWQLTLSQNDYIEVFVENNSNTTNIIVEYATLRVL